MMQIVYLLCNSEAKIVSIPSMFTVKNYSTVTDLARFLGWSTSVPLIRAT
jgi:hypothetical protein